MKRGPNVVRPQIQQPLDESIRYIPLTLGKITIVDAGDYEWLNSFAWQAMLSRGAWYASRLLWEDGKCKRIKMHQAILSTIDGSVPDHKNGNGLDNRRDNLRPATRSQNCGNRRTVVNKSGFKGVSWASKDKKWRARIGVSGKALFLGTFATADEAAHAYDAAALKHFGEFARLNFPPKAA